MYKKLSLLFLVLAISSCSSQKKNSYPVIDNTGKAIPIYFDTDSAKLTEDSLSILKSKILPGATNINTQKVIIEAHCDERGTASYNQTLSVQRANSVKNFLVKNGVSNTKIKAVGYGESKPVALGHNEESWSQNRRAVTISRLVTTLKSHFPDPVK